MLLNASHLRTLGAAMDRIVPSERSGSKAHAHIVDFIVELISNGALDIEMYQSGLTALEEEACIVGGASFESLQAEVQDDILASVEAGQVVTKWSVLPTRFIRSLVSHCMEGYCRFASQQVTLVDTSFNAVGFDFRI